MSLSIVKEELNRLFRNRVKELRRYLKDDERLLDRLKKAELIREDWLEYNSIPNPYEGECTYYYIEKVIRDCRFSEEDPQYMIDPPIFELNYLQDKILTTRRWIRRRKVLIAALEEEINKLRGKRVRARKAEQ